MGDGTEKTRQDGNGNVNKINYFVIIYGNDGNALMIFASLGHKTVGWIQGLPPVSSN